MEEFQYQIGKTADTNQQVENLRRNQRSRGSRGRKGFRGNTRGGHGGNVAPRNDLPPVRTIFDKILENVQTGEIGSFSKSASSVSVTFGGNPRENDHGEVDRDSILEYLKDLTGMDFQKCTSTVEIIRRQYIVTIDCPNDFFSNMLISKINEGTEFTMAKAELKTKDEIKVQQIMVHFKETSENKKVFQKHAEKIAECEELLQELERKGNKKHEAFEEWEARKALKIPLQSKLEELKNQQNEFEHFIEKLHFKLQSLVGSSTFGTESDRMRKEFALEMARFENCLPMYARKSDVIDTVIGNQVSVILGETGSGKSTQMLQYLHEACLHENGIIVCTQPRKVAAISLAQRVAQEMGTAVGGLVGYHVGMQAKKNQDTKLLYVTDHVLLNMCLKDRTFRPFSCIVIDEAHERSIYTDLLLGLVKRILPKRPDLKVVITSATIDPKVFVLYFKKPEKEPEVLKVSGRMFPVDVIYEKEDTEDYVTEAWKKAYTIHREEEKGDILVFLTSPLETEKAAKCLKKDVDNKAIVLELHGRLQVSDQQKVFEPTPEGKRKIVFATNSAETSITIPGIKYVVDTGRVREMTYDAKRNMSALIVSWTTQSSAEQRKGRAGRTAAGRCYRLYTEEQYDIMRPESVPEILRVHVGQALLKLMSLGIEDVTGFDFVQSPSKDAIDSALSVLRDLGAYDDNGITEIGRRLAKLSLEPRLGKVALLGTDHNVAYEGLIMAAVMSVGGSIFFRAGSNNNNNNRFIAISPRLRGSENFFSEEQKQEADRRKTKFTDEFGDVITLTNVFREWESIPERQRNSWCVANSINAKSMRLAKDVLKDTMQAFSQDIGIKIEAEYSKEADVNKIMAKIIFSCYGANLSRYSGHRMAGYVVAKSPTTMLHIHPSSSLNYIEEFPQWVVYEQILTTSKTYLMNATPVDVEWVLEALVANKINFDLPKLQEFLPTQHKIPGVGKTSMKKLKQNRAAELKRLEENIKTAAVWNLNLSDSGIVMIDINSEIGAINLFARPLLLQTGIQIVNGFLEKNRNEMRMECLEKPLVQGESSVRMLLKEGAKIGTILMPGEARQIKISDVVSDKVDVQKKLEEYGKIEKIDRAEDGTGIWGHVTFEDPKSVKKLQDDHESRARLRHLADDYSDDISVFLPFKFEIAKAAQSVSESKRSGDFTVKLVATQRPHQGYGFINFGGNIEEMFSLSARVCDLLIFKRFGDKEYTGDVMISVSNKNSDDLYIKRIPYWADEAVLRDAIAQSSPGDAHFTVRLPRVKITSEPESEAVGRALKVAVDTALQMYAHDPILPEDYTMNMIPYKPQTYEIVSFLNFSNAAKAQKAVQILSGQEFNKGVIQATLNLQAKYFVSAFIYNMIKATLDSEIHDLSEIVGVKASIRAGRFGNQTVIIESCSFTVLARIKANLNCLIEGQQLEVAAEDLKCFSHAGASTAIRQIERNTGTRFRQDHKRDAVYLHGTRESIQAARTEIDAFLVEMRRNPLTVVNLRSGELAAKGLMKALVTEYGNNLERLHNVIEAQRVELVLREQKIHVQCTEDEYNKLLGIIRTKAASLPPVTRTDDSPPDCPICLIPVDLTSCYITECCGHYYCQECATNLVQNAITNQTIPISCASEGCTANFFLQDFRNLGTSMDKLCESALKDFMATNTKSYGHCLTPDCAMVYRKWVETGEGLDQAVGGAEIFRPEHLRVNKKTKFTCSLCAVDICTKCESIFHVGMSCELFSHSKGKGADMKEVGEWIAIDPKNRGFCPTCFVGIEKNGGCLHMQCTKCRTHICWVCRKTFSNDSDTYLHIRHNCGKGDIY